MSTTEPCPRCGRVHDEGPCPPAAAPDQATQFAVSQVEIEATRFETASEGEPPPEDIELPPGTRVGEYEVVRKIGEGGMGMVFEAVHPLIGRKVAIKVINAIAGANAGAAARFLQEARAASMVRHRNIVDVFAFGQLRDGRSYLVMEFLEGEPLSSYLYRRGPLSFRQGLAILEGVVAGLGAAHAKGVVHRDLKPDNIWILPPDDGSGPDAPDAPGSPDAIDPLRIKLLDFGIAKLTADGGSSLVQTRAGAPIGTPWYMSPEQCRGDARIDGRSDIYALGVILYELFSAQVPFRAENYVEVLSAHLNTPPPSLADLVGMPPDLEEVLMTALAKDPARRYQTVAELRAALVACDAAADWAPLGYIDYTAPAAVADPGAATHAPAAATRPVTAATQLAAADVTLPALDTGALRAAATLHGGTLGVHLHGELDDGPEVRALATWLGDALEATKESLDRVVLDVTELAFCGMKGSACLADWLDYLRDARADGLAPATVRYSESVRWQRVTIPALQRNDPALRLESR